MTIEFEEENLRAATLAIMALAAKSGQDSWFVEDRAREWFSLKDETEARRYLIRRAEVFFKRCLADRTPFPEMRDMVHRDLCFTIEPTSIQQTTMSSSNPSNIQVIVQFWKKV